MGVPLRQSTAAKAPSRFRRVAIVGWLALAIAGVTPASAQSPAPFGSAPAGPPPPHGGAVAPLPEIEPAPPTPPEAAPQPPPPAPATPLDTTRRFVLRGYKIDGNTVLPEAAIQEIFASYLNKPVSLADLEEIRTRLTKLYIERGYINSGFVIPDQDASSGIVAFHAVEGRVTEVDTTGTVRFSPDYFNERLERGLTVPFNVNDLQSEQQILLQDPLVRQLNLDVQPGLSPGEAKVQANVVEASPYALNFQVANNQSPTVGETRGQVQGSISNVLVSDDTLAAQYGRSDGLSDGAVSYSLPLAADDTRLSLRKCRLLLPVSR
jgi:hemolysin activation/secretion protein